MPSRPPRLFDKPWNVVEHTESFSVEDASGNVLAYVYFEDERQRAVTLRRMGKDDARRLAHSIALIPERQAKLKAFEDGL